MFRDIDTADAHGTRGGPEIAGEDPQDRALARAVGSEQADDFSCFDGEGYATHGNAGAIALHKALDDNNVRLRHGITASIKEEPRGPETARPDLRVNNFYSMGLFVEFGRVLVYLVPLGVMRHEHLSTLGIAYVS